MKLNTKQIIAIAKSKNVKAVAGLSIINRNIKAMIAKNNQNHGDSGSLSMLMFMFPAIRLPRPEQSLSC